MRLNHYRGGHGEPLVLIHGIGSRWQMWEPVIDGLLALREVIALDLPGFGASPMPPAGTPAGVQSLVALVAEFLRENGIDRPHCAGNSLGGLIALELAKDGRVRSAAGLSPVGFANRPEMAGGRASLRLSVATARGLASRADGVMATSLGRTLALGLFLAHPARVTPQDAAASLRALAGAPWFDDTLRTMRPSQFTGGDQIEVPVTIAWGDKDRVLLPRQARRAAAAVPRARMVTLAGCGHVPTYDDRAQVTRALLQASSAR